jgi:hypothetical protein
VRTYGDIGADPVAIPLNLPPNIFFILYLFLSFSYRPLQIGYNLFNSLGTIASLVGFAIAKSFTTSVIGNLLYFTFAPVYKTRQMMNL